MLTMESFLKGMGDKGLLSREAIVKELQTADKAGRNAIAEGWVTTDPLQYLRASVDPKHPMNTNLISKLDASKRAEFDRAANSQLNQIMQRERERQADLRRQAEADHRAQSEVYETRIENAYRDGTLTTSMLMSGVELRLLSGEKYRMYREALDKQRMGEGPGDPDVISRFAADVYRAKPTTTHDQLEAAYNAHRLNPANGIPFSKMVEFKTQLRSAELRVKDDKDQSKQDMIRNHSQAEQLASAWLTTNSPFERLDQESQNLKALMLSELTRRSAAYGGTENPLEVVRQRLPAYVAQLSNRRKLSIGKIQGLLKYQTEQDLLNSKGKMSRQEYQSQIELFRYLRGLEAEEETTSKLDVGTGPAMTTPGAPAQSVLPRKR
jgi:hypothetical protein